jgi:hypothetical protein
MKHADQKMDKTVAVKAAKQAVKEHETKMHAKGGMVCRGMGAATKGGKFVKNG